MGTFAGCKMLLFHAGMFGLKRRSFRLKRLIVFSIDSRLSFSTCDPSGKLMFSMGVGMSLCSSTARRIPEPYFAAMRGERLSFCMTSELSGSGMEPGGGSYASSSFESGSTLFGASSF